MRLHSHSLSIPSGSSSSSSSQEEEKQQDFTFDIIFTPTTVASDLTYEATEDGTNRITRTSSRSNLNTSSQQLPQQINVPACSRPPLQPVDDEGDTAVRTSSTTVVTDVIEQTVQTVWDLYGRFIQIFAYSFSVIGILFGLVWTGYGLTSRIMMMIRNDTKTDDFSRNPTNADLHLFIGLFCIITSFCALCTTRRVFILCTKSNNRTTNR